MAETHDVVVLGGGPGGYATAFRAAARGLDVAVVEGDLVGGTCLNRGCIPSKAALHVAEVLEQVRRGKDIGLTIGPVALDGPGLDRFRTSVMDRMRSGLTSLVESRARLVRGWATVEAASDEGGAVLVTGSDGSTTELEGRAVVVATGSSPRRLAAAPHDGTVVLSSDDAVRFTEAPPRALVIGGGAIGMEFASMWRSMGSHVTVVEAAPRVLPLEDPDSSAALLRAVRKRGIEVLTDATVTEVSTTGSTARASISASGTTTTVEADVVLVAVGRQPRTEGIGLERLGVLDERGFVATDAYGQTAVGGLWAVGDVRPTLALAHAAFAEGFVVADRIAGVSVEPVDQDHVPRVTFCHPEVASVGLTEAAARASHGEVAVATYPLRANAKSAIEGTDGFVKVVSGAGAGGPVLGVHIVGPRATDLVAEATLATAWGALPEELAAIAHAHPTLYESLGEAFLAAAGVPFHGH